MVQWLGLRTSTAGGAGSVPGQGTKVPLAALHGKEKEKKVSHKQEDLQTTEPEGLKSN